MDLSCNILHFSCLIEFETENFSYIVSQKATLPWLANCYNFNICQPILMIFGRNVIKKVRSQMVLIVTKTTNFTLSLYM